MKQAALGFRAHSGWTALVVVSLEHDGPHVLARERPRLVETFTYEFRQPYHTAEKMPLDRAHEFISHIESSATRLAKEAIRSVQTDIRKQGYELTCFGLPVASTKPVPKLDKILESHALIHAADGELFRRALIHASERWHEMAFTIKERELLVFACKTLRIKSDDLKRRLTAIGKLMGPPWSQDEKFAVLTAWLALLSSKGHPTLGANATGRGDQ